MIRTDCHRPSTLISDDYQYICSYFDYIKGCDQLEAFRDHQFSTKGKFAHIHGYGCDICGTSFLNYSIYFHQKTNQYVKVGEICASKIDMAIFDRLRTEESQHLIKAGKAKCKQLFADNGIDLDRVYDLLNDSENIVLAQRPISLLTSVIGTIQRSGKISDKQVSFANNLLQQIVTATQKETEIKQKAVNVPEWEAGRQTITATVFKVNQSYSDFGLVTKLMAKTDLGQALMFNCPSSVDDPDDLKDKRIQVTLTLKPTEDKITGRLTFAFGSRPTKLKVIAE